MTITKYDKVAILPKRCDRCNRLFWLEPYNIFYKTVGIGDYSFKQTECQECLENEAKKFKEAMENVRVQVKPYEPDLDKIKAEIIARDRNVKAIRSDGRCFFTAEEVLEIIDKYTNESKGCFTDYPDMPYQFDNMTGSMNL